MHFGFPIPEDTQYRILSNHPKLHEHPVAHFSDYIFVTNQNFNAYDYVLEFSRFPYICNI